MAEPSEGTNEGTGAIWIDRRGPLGSLQEKQWHQQQGLPLPDPVAAIKSVIKEVAAGCEGVRITCRERDGLGGFKLSDHEVTRLDVILAIATLPHRQRRIVELLYFDGKTHAQAAGRLHIGERTLREDLALAWPRLVRLIFDYEVDER